MAYITKNFHNKNPYETGVRRSVRARVRFSYFIAGQQLDALCGRGSNRPGDRSVRPMTTNIWSRGYHT